MGWSAELKGPSTLVVDRMEDIWSPESPIQCAALLGGNTPPSGVIVLELEELKTEVVIMTYHLILILVVIIHSELNLLLLVQSRNLAHL